MESTGIARGSLAALSGLWGEAGELGAPRGVGTAMRTTARLRALFIVVSAVLGLAASERAVAQVSGPRTGFEVALSGSSVAFVGRPLRLRGTAYEVRGLATLAVLPGATVRARYATDAADVAQAPWVATRAARDGTFSVDVPIAADAHGASRVDVSVGDGADERVIEVDLSSLASPLALDLMADRNLYEAGERVHVWTRVRDRAGLAPVAGTSVRFVVDGLGTRTVTTGASGVAALSLDLPETEREGERDVHVTAGQGVGRVEGSTSFRVGRRDVDRLLLDVEVTPEAPAPEAPVEIVVHARTASGANVRGARVVAEVAGVGTIEGVTDETGTARLSTRAPAFLPDESGWVGVTVTVTHSAQGARTAQTRFVLAQARALTIEAVVPGRVLVPETDGELYVSLTEPTGDPPPAGAGVTVSGLAVRGGTFRGTTDRHGLLAVPTRLPRGAAALHQGDGSCSGSVATSVDITVDGELPRAARVCVPVDPDALVAVRASSAVISSGARLDVVVSRRPVARTRDVVVDLVAVLGAVEERIESKRLSPSESRTSFVIPAGRVGVMRVRARPVEGGDASEGPGASDAVLVRPAQPVFPVLEADRPVYPVRGTAHLTVRTAAGATGWVALAARDLAAHGGEMPFQRRFLEGAFDRAVLDPQTPDAERLVRAALAASVTEEQPPSVAAPLVDALGAPVEDAELESDVGRGDLRDPIPAGLELVRRGAAEMMRSVEEALASAVEGGDLDGVVVTERGRHRFADDVLGEDAVTLGGQPATVAMLTAADPSFTFDSVARRVARQRLVTLLIALAAYLDPPEESEGAARALPGEPSERWLSRMVQLGLLDDTALLDPWGGHFGITRSRRAGALSLGVAAFGLELASPGPDGRLGTADDVRDPFERAVAAGTPWAVASGEDALMAVLSLIAPGPEVLTAITSAYARMTDAALEEQRGDAAAAGVSELYGTGVGGGGTGEGTIGLGGLGTIGHGSGSGSGSGYGRGAGGFSGRSSRVPQIRTGSASVQGGGRGLLSALMRRRFPATLAFVPDHALDPSGQTVIDIPLADAVTSYRIDAIVWGPDGWTWPAELDIRVDQETVIDAPVPPFATVGDRIRLPVRIGNRTGHSVRVRAHVAASAALGGGGTDSEVVEVAANDGARVVVELVLARAGEGELTIAAMTPDGRAIDAIERPIVVLDDTRRVRDQAEAIIDRRGPVELTVPRGARARGAPDVRVTVGRALFPRSGDTVWEAWGAAMRRETLARQTADAALTALPEPESQVAAGLEMAAAIGALWSDRALTDARATAGLAAVTRSLGAQRRGERVRVALLLGLAPAARRPDARPALAADLRRLVTELRQLVEADSVSASDAPTMWALGAGALALSSSRADDGARVAELVRRARRTLVGAGDDLWLEADPRTGTIGGSASPSACLAIAALSIGDRELAFALVRTILRASSATGGSARATAPGEIELAGAALAMLGSARAPSVATVTIDGTATRSAIAGGVATVAAAGLGSPGAHRVDVTLDRAGVALVRASTEYGVAWTTAPAERGPVTLALTGEVGHADGRSSLVLAIHNRAPRLLSRPIVEIDLPAGAELDEPARRRLAAFSAVPPALSGRTLTLVLRPLRPAGTVRVELPIRWSIAGHVRGLGVASWADDRPRAVSILRSREVEVTEASEGGAR